MSLATKNVATVLVGSVLVLALSFAVATPAKADMLSDLQAQVQALLAQIAALQGGSTSTGNGCFAFTMTHQMGDSGGEVMQIQKFLNGHGAQVSASGAGSPGNESSYFGALTRAAVAKWQAANGVSPAAGYWGPLTRAKVASVCAGSTPTTPGGTPTTGGLNGTAGTASFTATSEDVEDEVLTGQTEKVSAFKVEASGSDIRVTNVRVKFDKDSETGSASDYLTAYFSEVSVWANGTKIGSMSASSFTRDSAGVYSASIPVDQIVRMGSGNKVTFHIGATANSAVDSDDIAATNDWTVDVTQVRYTDASGAVLFENPSTMSPVVGRNNDVNVDRLSNSSDVTLRMAEGSGNPKAGNVEVSDSNSTEVTLAEFTLKAEGTDMTFDSIDMSTTTTGVATADMVQTFFLYRGSSRIAEVAGSAADLDFDLDDIENISAGSTQTYRVVAKVNAIATTTGAAGFDNGDSLMVTIVNTTGAINAKASDGKSVTDRSGSVSTYAQTMYSEGIQISKVSESFTHNANATTPESSTGEFKVTLRITNFGDDDVYIPLNSTASSTAEAGTTGVSYGVLNSGNNATTTTQTSATVSRVSGGTEESSSIKIGAGSSADIQLAVTYNPVNAGSSAQYRVQIWGVGTAATNSSTATKFTAATPVVDFRTGFNTVND